MLILMPVLYTKLSYPAFLQYEKQTNKRTKETNIHKNKTNPEKTGTNTVNSN